MLLREGLTLASSNQGSFFYLIVGMHALHVCGALSLLVAAWMRLNGGLLAPSFFSATLAFWTFVVALWPILYLLVYQ
jgi:heme/copper-type cytochrome/quinol oxidase subunit 3